MPGESKKTNSSAKTSEQLVEELLESVRGRDKESKKEKKHHKHKKEKKSKHKHRSRSRERKKWKKRDRSRSKSKDRHKDKKRRHRSISQSTFDNVEKKDSLREFSPKRPKPDDDRLSPVPSCSSSHGAEDDDLPAGADFQTVLEEARKQRGSESIGTSFDLSLLPCEQGQSHRQRDFDNFPVAKERSKSPGKKNESEILKKVIDEKGAGEFIPRNVLLKTKEKEPERPDSPHSILIDVHPKAIFFNIKTNVIETKTEVRMETKVAKEECGKEKIVIEEKIVEKTVEVMEVDEYGPSVPVESTMEVEKVVENLLPTEPPAEQKEEPVKTKTTSVEEINLPYKNNNEWEFTVKPLPSAPKETNEKAKKKKKESKEKKKEKRKSRSRSPDRSRSRKRSKSKEKKRRRSVSRSRERRSRSRSREVRRRSRSRDQRRARSRSYNRDKSRRRSWSRGRRSRSRSRDREECRIDKAKLLEIAKKRRAAGIFDIGDPNPKSVEDFVSYCEKLQKRQDREDRRARGEVVSDNESEIAAPSFKPYKSAAPFNDSITINIVNAVSLPTKSAEECILDTAALRVVYPVSSGQVHRENTEWQKVEKEAPLMTASTVQKNFKALSSLDAERVRQKAKQQLEQAPAFMLPPPPAPPALPLPPVPPKITAEDTLMPAPPPVPATLIIPSKEKMIIKEPEQISSVPPKNVAEVLAKRAKAQRVLEDDPNDFHAMRDLKDANEQMNTWAQLKSLPGKFTGTTGVDVMSAEELQPHDPRGNAWVRKDMFKQLAPNFGGGIGLRMMQRMGWRPGTGLGRECTGSLEPLTLDVKNDRKGLSTEEDLPARSNKNLNRIHGTDLTGKHPVSLVMEMCAKRKWQSPIFTCMETGPSHQREFVWRAVVNGVEYCSATTSRNKKDGKSIVCQVVLQSMGLVPRDPTLPVLI